MHVVHTAVGASYTMLSNRIAYALNPAQNHAWDAFWANATAPDGIGLETHHAQMLQVVANYFKDNPAVAAFAEIGRADAKKGKDVPWMTHAAGGLAIVNVLVAVLWTS